MSTFCQSRSRRRSFSLWGLIVVAWVAGIGLGHVQAQGLSVLHSFGLTTASATEGDTPASSLVQDADGNLYGTTSSGGSANAGTLYKVAPDGTFTLLHSFGAGNVITAGTPPANSGTGSGQIQPQGDGSVPPGTSVADGTHPSGNLTLASDGFIYGTTVAGGESYGTVWRISTAGDYSIVHVFYRILRSGVITVAPPDLSLGAYPESGVIKGADGNLYGTTFEGGAGVGVLFKIRPDFSYEVVHEFETTGGDAVSPALGLTQDAQGNIYGVSTSGGSAGLGAVFKLSSQGYSILYSFTAAPSSYTFSLGSNYSTSLAGGFVPNSSVAVDAQGNIYGTATSSNYGSGALYELSPAGTFTILHLFRDNSAPGDGVETLGLPGSSITPPTVPIVADRLVRGADGTLYGVTAAGGTAGQGSLFKWSSNGQVSILHSFADGSVLNDGVAPQGLILGANGKFYGTTRTGGANGNGTIFKFSTTLPGFTSPLRVAARLNAPFTYALSATLGPNTYTVSGLPAGFTFDGVKTITATPAVAGTYTITLTATNAAGSNSAPLVVTVVTPPMISSLLHSVGSTAGVAYQITATQNPTSFGATGLPPGVSIDPASGHFYGVPTATGTYNVAISATNGVGTGTASLMLQILSAEPTSSQGYSQIHRFNTGAIDGEGTFPGAMTLAKDGSLYGVTAQGGAGGGGTVFNLLPSGVSSVVASFNGTNGSAPQALMQMADGTLYGTTQAGGAANLGVIFKITPDGTLTVIHSFGDGTVPNDGANPQAGLVLSNGNFYGTTQYGGSAGKGVVYQMTTTGVVTTLHSFGDGSVTNDGAQPVAELTPFTGLSFSNGDGTYTAYSFLGTTLRGGAQDVGTIFAMSPTGQIRILHSFGDPAVANDGQLPHGPLLLPTTGLVGAYSGPFYGTTTTGGSLGKGTIYSFSLAGATTILHSFGDGSVANDGENPISSLIVVPPSINVSSGISLTINGSGGIPNPVLCGTTKNGGANSAGTVFTCVISSNGAGATTAIVHNFGDPAVTYDGTTPLGSGVVVGADNNVYGTTMSGGNTFGTAFALQTNQSDWLSLPTTSGGWSYTGTLPAGMSFDPTSGTLLGTPSNTAAVGAYSVTIAFNGLSVGGTNLPRTINFQLNQSFAAWANLHAVSSVVTSGSSGGPTDGVPLLLKYLVNAGNPNQPMTMADHAAMPTMMTDDTSVPGVPYLALTWRQNPGMIGLDVGLEFSNDLVTWSPVTSPLKKQIATDSVTGAPIMEMGAPMDGTAHQFLRLKVTPQ